MPRSTRVQTGRVGQEDKRPNPLSGLHFASTATLPKGANCLVINFSDTLDLERKVIAIASALGYKSTSHKSRWLTWAEISSIYNLPRETAMARVKAEMRSGNEIEVKRSTRSYITSVYVTPELDRELSRPLQKGTRKYEQ